MPRRAAILAASALLTACASQPPAAPPPERRATLPPHTVTIHTSPPGGIVDWNGNVLGAAPVQISFVPGYQFHRPRWPDNGHLVEILRARWPDGTAAAETFISSAAPPTEIGIVAPYQREIILDAPPSKRYPNKLRATR